MAESFVQLNNDGPGKQIDTWTEATNGRHRQAMVIADPSVTANVVFVTAANALKIDGSAVTQPISGSITVLNASIPVAQSGTWNIGTVTTLTSITNPVAVTGTFFQATQPISATSLPLPTGASTAANQSTEITSLATLVTNTPPVGQALMAASSPVAIASNQSAIPVSESGTWTVQPGNTANTTPWLTTINQGGNSAFVNATNELLVTDSDLTLAQSSTTAGQLGPLIQGAVTTAAPAYTTAQTNPLSLTTVGNLRVDGSSVTQPVSGTVTANQGTANATPWNANISQVGGSTVSTSAAGVMKVGITGSAATGLDGAVTAAASPTNGLMILSLNNTTAPSLTTGQSIGIQSDYTGSLFVKPYRRSETVSKATTIAASTTTTTVLAAQAAGIFADITQLWISVAQTTTVTAMTCTLSDGTNSYLFDVESGITTTGTQGLGVNINFNPPLPATTAATAWTITNSSATPTVHITVIAVLQKAS